MKFVEVEPGLVGLAGPYLSGPDKGGTNCAWLGAGERSMRVVPGNPLRLEEAEKVHLNNMRKWLTGAAVFLRSEHAVLSILCKSSHVSCAKLFVGKQQKLICNFKSPRAFRQLLGSFGKIPM